MKTKIIFLLVLCLPFCLLCQVHEEWDARYLGANDNSNSAHFLTYDNYGNIYITGESNKINGGNSDRLTVKYNNRGEFQWAVRRDTTSPGKITVDNNGNILVCGYTNNYTSVLTKYTSYGSVLWEIRSSSSFNDMVIDDFENIYVTGYGSVGNQSGFITKKYNSSGTLLWTSSYLNSDGSNEGRRIILDNSGNVYVTGISRIEGIYSLVLIKYNNVGQQLFWRKSSQQISTYYNTNYLGLDKDNTGNIYTAGINWGTGDKCKIIITKFNSTGNEIWYRKFNSLFNISDEPVNMSVLENGSVVLTGNSRIDTNYHSRILFIKYDSTGQLKTEKYFDTAYSHSAVSDFQGNVYLTFRKSVNYWNAVRTFKLDTIGNQKWRIDYWGISDSYIRTINTDNYGNVYIAGNTTSTQHPAFLTVRYLQSLNSISTVTGCVKKQENNIPVSGGYVKAIKYDTYSGNLITIDSSVIQNNGYYSLKNITQDSLYIVAFPNNEQDFVPSFYPNGIYWQNAIKIYTSANLSDINIFVPSIIQPGGNGSVGGKIFTTTNKMYSDIKTAFIYTIMDNSFVGYGISGTNGIYKINLLPAGNLKVIALRIGYTSDSSNIYLSPSYNYDSINFCLNKISVGINNIAKKSPDSFKLYQNYPNPFNPSTNIRFQIKESKFVTLKVYDILGKEIATLVNEKLAPGIYETLFSINNITSPISSGVYFYKLETDNFVDVKRFVLVK
jgi:hypothetical protein